MQWLQTAYTVWFNRRHNLSGHLFGGRYKAVLIDEGEPQGKMLHGYVGTVLRTETTVPLNWIARRLDLGVRSQRLPQDQSRQIQVLTPFCRLT
jgi:hypothetical protein